MNQTMKRLSPLPVWLQLVLLAVATLLVYGHTLDVPFYLDDFSSVVDNPVIYDTENFLELWQYAPLRIVGYVTFIFNYMLHQFNPAGYHLVNIGIHLLAGIAVFFLTRGLLKTSVVHNRYTQDSLQWLPLTVAAFFLVHPMQTQGVTYIVQRLASMAAFFYLAALASYVYARLSHAITTRCLLLVLVVVFMGLGLFTKQNCITLPLVILALEYIFFPGDRRRTLIVVGVMVIGGGLGWLLLARLTGVDFLSVETIDRLTRDTTTITRGQYLATQINVVWTYIRMYVWPTGLHLDHDVTLVTSVANVRVLIGVIGHFFLFGLGVVLVRKSPLLAFAIFFYYLAHLVESSIIPIRDLLFEHRAYLPNFGLCLFTGVFLLVVLPKVMKQWLVFVLTGVLILGWGTAAWSRNEVWRDPIAFWRDSAEKAPAKARPWNELGKHLVAAGRIDEAIVVFYDAAQLGGSIGGHGGIVLDETASVNLMMAFAQRGETELALELADGFLLRPVKPINRSKMLTNKGNLLLQQKYFVAAEQCYRDAIQSFQKNIMPINNLGILLMMTGRLDEAKLEFEKVLAMNPHFEVSRKKLEQLKAMKGNN